MLRSGLTSARFVSREFNILSRSSVCVSRNQILRNQFSTSSINQSYIGSSPITIPENVEVTIVNMETPILKTKGPDKLRFSKKINVKGPLGEENFELANFINIKKEDKGKKMTFSVKNPDSKIQKTFWGTTRATVYNHIIGVTEGHLAILKLLGTGYKAQLETIDDVRYVSLKIGFCNAQLMPIPKDIVVKIPVPTRIIIEGSNKQQVNLLAGQIKQLHPPDPYKGKVSEFHGYQFLFRIKLLTYFYRVFIKVMKQLNLKLRRLNKQFIIFVYICIYICCI